MDWSKYPNFSPDEFRCQHCVTAQCGSNDLVISEQLICADDRVKGIGVNQKGNARFLHIDVKEDSPRPNIWSY